jgi:hypothetical protein
MPPVPPLLHGPPERPPISLLHGPAPKRNEWVKLAVAASPPAAAMNAAAKGLANDVHLGEQRIIHRRIRKRVKESFS